uniref:Uncharacterized protein n=1 Tax=Tanacetum cinerariifolium TaxID=118510 RepID=A0A699JLA1_TANCI|nr:hypothetical protein [Tanacetum cinerariifolium]
MKLLVERKEVGVVDGLEEKQPETHSAQDRDQVSLDRDVAIDMEKSKASEVYSVGHEGLMGRLRGLRLMDQTIVGRAGLTDELRRVLARWVLGGVDRWVL